jgi:hypothetical protein
MKYTRTIVLTLFVLGFLISSISSIAAISVEDTLTSDREFALMGYNYSFIAPTDGETISGQYLVRFVGDYNGNPLVRCRASIYQGRTRLTSYVDMTQASAYEWQIVWDTETFEDGDNYRVRVLAYRTTRRYTRIYSGYVTIDNSGGPDTTPPSVSITNPADDATVSGTVSIAATASDNIGVTYVECQIDSGAWVDDTTSPYSWTWDTTLETDGSHAITCRAWDAAGNSATDQITVTVDNSEPPPPPPIEGIYPWWNDLIDAEVAHANGITGQGSVVVIIDTGLVSNWQDYFSRGNILTQYCYSQTLQKGKDNVDWNEDTEGHGTACTGTVIGYDLNNDYYIGAAPDAQIIMIRTLYWVGGSGSQYVSATEMLNAWAEAIDYARDLHNNQLSGYDMIVSMSLGYDSTNTNLNNAVSNAEAAGIVVVTSAGNDGHTVDTTGYPANLADATSVAAAGWDSLTGAYGIDGISTDIAEGDFSELHIADFSSGGKVDVTGIGENLVLPYYGGYYYISGTSFSCPQTAGVYALMFQALGSQSVQSLETQLQNTCYWNSGYMTARVWGAGFIQADAACGF